MQGFINGIEKSGLLAAVTEIRPLQGRPQRLGENPAPDPRKINPDAFDLCCATCSVLELVGVFLFVFLSWQVSSWGGYVFLINLIPLHVLVLMLTGRFSHRIYVAYCTVYCLGTILSMQISFVGFQVGTGMVCGLEDGHFMGCSRTAASWHPVSLLAFVGDIIIGCWLQV